MAKKRRIVKAPGWLSAVLLIISLVVFSTFIAHVIVVLGNPYPQDFGEGIVMDLAVQLGEKGTYYFPIDEYPFTHAAYTPVFMVIAAVFVKMFGPVLAVTRLLSVLAMFVIVILIYLILRQQLQGRVMSAAFALISVAPWFVYGWAVFGRVDILAIMFSLIGLYWYIRFKDRDAGYACHAFFILAFLTKQSMLAAPAALILYIMMIKKDVRRGIIHALLYALPLLVICLLLDIITRGQFIIHTFTYHSIFGIDAASAAGQIPVFLVYTLPLLVMVALALWKYRRIGLYVAYSFFALLTLVLIGKPGSNVNVFIEPFIALLLLAGISARHLLACKDRRLLITGFVLLVVLFVWLAIPYANPFGKIGHELDYRALEINEQQKIMDIVDASDEVLVENPGYAVIAGKTVAVSDPYYFWEFSRQGMWDPKPLVRMCESREFDMIMPGVGILGMEGMQECLQNNYNLHDSKHSIYLVN